MFFSGDNLKGFAFAHPRILSDADFVGLLRQIAPVGSWEHRTMSVKSDAQMFVGSFSETNEHHSRVLLVEQRKANFGEFDDLLPNQAIYWAFFRKMDLAKTAVRQLGELTREEDLAFYRLRLRNLVSDLILSELEHHPGLKLTRLGVHVPNQENVSNVSSVIFNAREDSGLMRNGIISFLRAKYSLVLRAAELNFSVGDAPPIRLLIDGYGNMRVTDYRNTARFDQLAAFIAYLVQHDLLTVTSESPLGRGVLHEMLEAPAIT